MIPKLYPKTQTSFTTAGLGELSEASECVVTEERNGEYTLSMTYPVTGKLYSQIQNDSLILAKPNVQHQPQPFRVYDISRPINGIVTISAEHISYQTNSIPVFPFTASSIAAAVAAMKSNSAVTNPFTFSTTKTTIGTMKVSKPASFRSLMGGAAGSLLDVYGTGEYLYDRWNITLQAQRGADTGVLIEYGVNLVDLKQEENIASLITGVAPFWQKDDVLVTLPEKTIQLSTSFSYPRVITLDLSQDFETAPTVAQLRTAAQAKFNASDLTVPKVSLTVNFVDLSQTDEYKDMLAAVSSVMLCDTVTVRFVKLGVNTKAKVIRTEFDVLKDRYTSIELGEPKSSFTSAQYQLIKEVEAKPSVDFMAKAIETATDLITGNSGGHIIFRPKDQPQEMLIMDTEDVATALKVWRYNLSGWGYSSTGVNGPFRLAATMDGAIVADFITAGILNANIIRAGVLASANGVTSLDLQTGILTITNSTDIFKFDSDQLAMFINGEQVFGIMSTPQQDGKGAVFTGQCSLADNNLQDIKATWVITSDGSGGTLATKNIRTIDLRVGSDQLNAAYKGYFITDSDGLNTTLRTGKVDIVDDSGNVIGWFGPDANGVFVLAVDNIYFDSWKGLPISQQAFTGQDGQTHFALCTQ